MAANLVSAKVSVFYSKIAKTFPKSSQQFYLAQTLIKHKKHNQNIGQINYLLNNNKEKYWVVSQQALLFKALQLGIRFQRCSHERQELKHKESIIKHVKTHLSLTYFLCIGILQANKLSTQAKTSICKEAERNNSNLNITRGNLVT